jgi:hypothetical protein
VKRPQRVYEDYEEMGQYLQSAREGVLQAQAKSFDMFGGLDPLTEGTVTMETTPTPTSYDTNILQLVLILNDLRSELAMNFHAEIEESEVPPGKPRTPPPFDSEVW